jgi:hypothetical protein
LEERRKVLVARSEELREALGTRCGAMAESSYWVCRGYEIGEKIFANRSIISSVFKFLRRSREPESESL